MTVAALPPSISYVENGASLSFAVPFRFLDGEHLVVTRVVGGAETILTYGAAYTVTGGDTDAGGTVLLGASINGATLNIVRATPRSQPMDYTMADRFPAESHERALDRLTMIAQEVALQVAAAQSLEQIQDMVAAMFVPGGGNVTATYDDALGKVVLTAPTSGGGGGGGGGGGSGGTCLVPVVTGELPGPVFVVNERGELMLVEVTI